MSCDTPVLVAVGKLRSTRGVNAVQVRAVVRGAAAVLHSSWETRFLRGCHTDRSSAVRQAAHKKQDATQHPI